MQYSFSHAMNNEAFVELHSKVIFKLCIFCNLKAGNALVPFYTKLWVSAQLWGQANAWWCGCCITCLSMLFPSTHSDIMLACIWEDPSAAAQLIISVESLKMVQETQS